MQYIMTYMGVPNKNIINNNNTGHTACFISFRYRFTLIIAVYDTYIVIQHLYLTFSQICCLAANPKNFGDTPLINRVRSSD